MTNKELHFDTLAIHAGSEEIQHQPLNPPIYLTSTFTFKDIQQVDDTFASTDKEYIYTRGTNPTINLLEDRMAILDAGTGAVAFASGMAAVSSVLLSLVKTGDAILAHRDIYGSSYAALTNLFSRFGIQTDFIDMTNLDDIARAITSNTKVIYFETPTNPLLEIIDIAEVVKIAQAQDIKVVIDNTFATPFLQKPLDLGADIVLYSATKYLSGHGDVLGGVAICKDNDYLSDLKFNYMCKLGGVISPFNAWLLLRGLKTLSLRMQRHEENAQKITEFLSNHPKVAKVIYPGLSSHAGYEIAKKQTTGFGGMVSFELHGDIQTAKNFVENIKLAKLAVSLGDAETLVEIPSLMTHRSYAKEMCSFSEKLIRLSTGLEDGDDIIYDISQALE
jgi:methionine-gamma-lyase